MFTVTRLFVYMSYIYYMHIQIYCSGGKLEGPLALFQPEEGCGNNRSVMPLDVPGCTRATMIIAVSIFSVRVHSSIYTHLAF